jgi:hypothetical protein
MNPQGSLTRKEVSLGLVAGAAIAVGLAKPAVAAQPHMAAALRALRTARTELVAAAPDKGGHRGNALKLLDQAIAEVQQGMSYAKGQM